MANVDGDIIDPSKTGRTVVATDGDQSSFGVECTDEILSPDISGDTSLIVADCIIDEDGNDETDEFQVCWLAVIELVDPPTARKCDYFA